MKKHVLFTIFLVLATITLSAQDLMEKRPPDNRVMESYLREGHFPGAPATDPDPYIQGILDDISEDSVRATLRSLQNFGSRFLLNDDRKEIAGWLAGRFMSYGITDVKLDSFLCIITNFPQFADTLWQYNVVATLPGKSAPGEEYVIDGHYDSFCQPDPYTWAPGVNDNGSAVAATLEIARVIMQNGYEPEATIKFCLFAAEELGLYGSFYQAQKARENNDDIRYVLNMDMISNNPDSLDEVIIVKYPMNEWAAFFAAEIFETYTTLQVNVPADYVFGGSDSYPYFLNGFPAIYVQEQDFSPYWHKPEDTLGNCNVAYCTEITKGACAVMLEQQLLPYPQMAIALSTNEDIKIYWSGSENANLAGYNLYRSDQPGTGYGLVNGTLIHDTSYSDASVPPGKMYYYVVKSVNKDNEESLPSQEVHGARFAFTDTLLVVNCLNGNEIAPDSIFLFYNAILDTIAYTWFNCNQSNPLEIDDLSTHRNVLFMTNNSNPSISNYPGFYDLQQFFMNGGNMLVAGFLPGKIFDNVTQYPHDFDEYSVMQYIFKIDSAFRKIGSLMYQAYPVAEGYDTLRGDTLKQMYEGYPGELYNIEVYRPTSEGEIIYRFDSKHDPGTTLGLMQDQPVGVQHIGDDYKTVLISFPLYYLDTTDAREFLHYVINHKFSDLTDVPEPYLITEKNKISNYPNPFSDRTTLVITLGEHTDVTLTLYDSHGSLIKRIAHQYMNKGEYHLDFVSRGLSPGLYNAVLTTRHGSWSCPLILTR